MPNSAKSSDIVAKSATSAGNYSHGGAQSFQSPEFATTVSYASLSVARVSQAERSGKSAAAHKHQVSRSPLRHPMRDHKTQPAQTAGDQVRAVRGEERGLRRRQSNLRFALSAVGNAAHQPRHIPPVITESYLVLRIWIVVADFLPKLRNLSVFVLSPLPSRSARPKVRDAQEQ